jgi:hypothetical protein
MENMIANHGVEEQRSGNADPDEHVICVDANLVPFLINPAPDL